MSDYLFIGSFIAYFIFSIFYVIWLNIYWSKRVEEIDNTWLSFLKDVNDTWYSMLCDLVKKQDESDDDK